MKRIFSIIAVVISLALVVSVTGVIAQATDPQGESSIVGSLGTAFTYQGQLKNASGPVAGSCDFQFSLWDSLANTSGQIGTTQSKLNVTFLKWNLFGARCKCRQHQAAATLENSST